MTTPFGPGNVAHDYPAQQQGGGPVWFRPQTWPGMSADQWGWTADPRMAHPDYQVVIGDDGKARTWVGDPWGPAPPPGPDWPPPARTPEKEYPPLIEVPEDQPLIQVPSHQEYQRGRRDMYAEITAALAAAWDAAGVLPPEVAPLRESILAAWRQITVEQR